MRPRLLAVTFMAVLTIVTASSCASRTNSALVVPADQNNAKVVHALVRYGGIHTKDVRLLFVRDLAQASLVVASVGRGPSGTPMVAYASVRVGGERAKVLRIEYAPEVRPALQGSGFSELMSLEVDGLVAVGGPVTPNASAAYLVDSSGNIIDTQTPENGAVILVGKRAAQARLVNGNEVTAASFVVPADFRSAPTLDSLSGATRAAADRFLRSVIRGDGPRAEDETYPGISSHALVYPLIELLAGQGDIKMGGATAMPGGYTYQLTGGRVKMSLTVFLGSSRGRALVYSYEYRVS